MSGMEHQIPMKTTVDGILNSDPYAELSDIEVKTIYDLHWSKYVKEQKPLDMLACRHYHAVIEYRRAIGAWTL